MLLSICIPTFNRSKFLDKCLNILLPQITQFGSQIEVIVIDNASIDDTMNVVKKYLRNYSFLAYHRNDSNIGYTGNQFKCYELSNGYYTAFLSDDDLYTENLIIKLQPILLAKKYCFIALNYYSFLESHTKKFKSNFAPEQNVEFKRAYDILNYPSVGHWSGLIINSQLAKDTLVKIRNLKSSNEFEKNRGIIGELIHRALPFEDRPSFFLGERLLAVKVPLEIDYDIINHIYLDVYKFYYRLFKDNYINQLDLNYRKKLILSQLSKTLIIECYKYSNSDIDNFKFQFDNIFVNEFKYKFEIRPLFYIIKIDLFKLLVKYIYRIYKNLKYKK
jgi:glycosyltransferase involved in cell wall biosynthesis